MSLDDLTADFDNHYIEGYARMAVEGDGYFKAPLISHVEGNLWQGGCRDGVTLPENFKYVLSLYKWEKYTVSKPCTRHTVTMYDSGDTPDRAEIEELAGLVNDWRNLDKGDVLVHCQAGLNRSGLVAALSLILRGYAPVTAISLLRASRSPVVLCNQSFENFLLNYNK